MLQTSRGVSAMVPWCGWHLGDTLQQGHGAERRLLGQRRPQAASPPPAPLSRAPRGPLSRATASSWLTRPPGRGLRIQPWQQRKVNPGASCALAVLSGDTPGGCQPTHFTALRPTRSPSTQQACGGGGGAGPANPRGGAGEGSARKWPGPRPDSLVSPGAPTLCACSGVPVSAQASLTVIDARVTPPGAHRCGRTPTLGH